MIISNSERASYQRCRLRWYYEYVKGIAPKKRNIKLLTGSAFHKFLEIWYKTKGDFEQAFNAMNDLIDDEIKNWDIDEVDEVMLKEMKILLEGMAKNYTSWYKEDLKKWNILETEKNYKIQLPNGIWYDFTIDMLIEDENGQKWLVDHKTASSIAWFRTNTPLDRQISYYLKAYKLLFPKQNIVGMIYNIIEKDFPEPPKVLKNGKLSQATNQKTTYELYVRTLRDYYRLQYPEFNPAVTWEEFISEYQSFLDYLSKKPNEYFYREKVIRLDAELDIAWQELIAVSKEKQALTERALQGKMEYIYRNPTKDCSWDCAYKELCLAGLTESDTKYLIENLYTTNTYLRKENE